MLQIGAETHFHTMFCCLWSDTVKLVPLCVRDPSLTLSQLGVPLKTVILLALEKLSFMHAKINKAYMMLGIIKCNFRYLTILTFVHAIQDLTIQ